MINKKKARLRRSRLTRSKIADQARKGSPKHRLVVLRTPRHTYAQLITPCGGKVVCSASTLDKELRSAVKHGGNKEAAVVVGKAIAEKIKQAGVESIAFDRSGFKYHGRVQALADAVREGNVQF
ncbi:MAG: 50S ribosomal protein L18 [Coxiellaceae bacterium]|nr:50S ribosomal protein L18 [Coxiellaceae bacterium]